MVNAYTGINFQIFSEIIDKYGDTVNRIVRTISQSNIEGDEKIITGVTINLQAYMSRKNRPWNFGNVGFIEGGDAVMLLKPGTAINRHDYIIWNGNTYRVENFLNRDQPGGNVAYIACNLFLVDDAV